MNDALSSKSIVVEGDLDNSNSVHIYKALLHASSNLELPYFIIRSPRIRREFPGVERKRDGSSSGEGLGGKKRVWCWEVCEQFRVLLRTGQMERN